MIAGYSPPDQYEADRAVTLRNRDKLNHNPNLLYWYRRLYREQFCDLPDPSTLAILEIGSGVSPLRRFYSNVVTSDVLDLDYLDHVFDCHRIDEVSSLANEGFDIITLTNVLHHLRSPVDFLRRAACKLKRGGKIIATEPYFSLMSTPIFKYLHHEAVDFSIDRPELKEIRGPLASANIALPWLLFVRHSHWCDALRAQFEFDQTSVRPFTSISYMLSGGISHRIPIPALIYRLLFQMDLALSRTFPKSFASFFTVILTRR